MLNQCIFVGRITKNVEIKESENGKKYSNLTLAVTRSYKNANGEYETDFINCSVFNDIAKSIFEYCKKGDLIGVKGRIESYSYEDKDGNKKYGQNVIAEKVTFLSSTKEKDKTKENSDINM